MGLEHLECVYILRGKQRVKAWQADLAGMRMAIKRREKTQRNNGVAVGEQSN